MRPFELVEPTTIEEAVSLLDAEDTGVRAIAGGTAVMLMMKTRLFQPTRLISLGKLNGTMRGVRVAPDGGLRIGALTTLSQMEHSQAVASAVPVVSRALRTLANVRIRNVATIGGHLAHGDPHMDLPPVLLTLRARVRAVGPRGERWVGLDELFQGYYQTGLSRDELIAEVEIPAQPVDLCSAYIKFTALNADDWPAVGIAVSYRIESGVVCEARIVVSAATECPVRLAGAEAAILGAAPIPQVFAKAGAAAAEEVNPLADIRGTASYKREMVRVNVCRALEQAAQLRPSEAI